MNRNVAGSRPICSHSSCTQRTISTSCGHGDADEDPVGEARGAADRGLGPAADEDRDRRRRSRPDADGRQVVDGPLVGERLAGPRLREDAQDLVHRGAAAALVGAEAGELDPGPAEPEPEQQPAVAQQLHRRGILGQADRVVQRREDHARRDLDPGGRLRDRRADDEERGHVPVVDEVVLGGPHRGEPEPLRLDRERDRLVVRARPVGLARPELRAEESEAESHGPTSDRTGIVVAGCPGPHRRPPWSDGRGGCTRTRPRSSRRRSGRPGRPSNASGRRRRASGRVNGPGSSTRRRSAHPRPTPGRCRRRPRARR